MILSFRKKTHTKMWKMNQNERTGYGHPSEANIIARVKTKGGPKLKQDCNQSDKNILGTKNWYDRTKTKYVQRQPPDLFQGIWMNVGIEKVGIQPEVGKNNELNFRLWSRVINTSFEPGGKFQCSDLQVEKGLELV